MKKRGAKGTSGKRNDHAAQYGRAVDEGRAPLLKAAAILECLIYTMAYGREATTSELRIEASDVALAAEVAQDYLKQSLKTLDAVSLALLTGESASV